MHFSEAQRLILACADRYSARHKVALDKEFVLLKLVEEMGEFSQAVLTHAGKCRVEKRIPRATAHAHMAEELADVVGMAVLAARTLDIDLEAALEEKWFSRGRKHLSKKR